MKPLLLSLLLSFSLLVQAQNWCPPGAEWAYRNSGVLGNGSSNLWYEKDTIIDGQQCHKIKAYLSNAGYIGREVDLFTFDRNDTVFFYHNSAFWPTYFFNTVLGDTLTIRSASDYLECDTFLHLLVDSVSTIQARGSTLRYYRYRYLNAKQPYPNSVQVIEKFGAIDNYILPVTECSGFIDAFYYDLGCYEDSSFSRFQVNSSVVCNYTYTEVTQPDLNLELNIFPNPATNQLNISIEGHTISQYQILDFTGAMVISNQADNSELSIDLSELAQGMYLLRVQLSNGQYAVRKFTLEK